MASMIGIKIANGEFYSIVEENSHVKKRLVLTTVHDKQGSVQIDLYKSYTRTMADALYIGSLVVENIRPRPKGDPSIELIISSKQNGEITADAEDLDPSVIGERQTLNVSLKSITEDELPDFELGRHEGPPAGLYEKAGRVTEEQRKRKFPWLAVICAALVITALALAAWLFLFRGGEDAAGTRRDGGSQVPAVSAPAAQPSTPAPQPAPPAAAVPAQTPPAPLPVIQAPEEAPPAAAPVSRERPAPPVASYKVPAVIPRGGVSYRIRWGDTLWDIAGAFYRNPWLYPRIARHNNIRDPDFIIAGRTIRVPPRN